MTNKSDMTPTDYHRIMDAYAVYDTDPRVHGPDDLDAFLEAVLPLLTPLKPYVATAPHCDPGESWT